MKVSFWAEVRRLHEVEGLSQRETDWHFLVQGRDFSRAIDYGLDVE